MNILFILEDGLKSTFYLYLLNGEEKKLLRFSPDVKSLEGKQLGQVFVSLSIEDFISFFGQQLSVVIKKYAVINNGTVRSFLFEENEIIEISNPEPFVSVTTHQQFPKGKQQVTSEELAAFIRYQLNAEDQGIFQRQEHVLRLIKNELMKDKNLLVLQKKFKQLNRQLTTNIKLTDLPKLFSSYRNASATKMKRLTIPGEQESAAVHEEPAAFDWPKQAISQFLA